MGWVSLIEAGIPKTTFRRKRKKGLIQWRYGASGRGGEAGKHVEVYIDDQKAVSSKHLRAGAENKPKNRYRVHRGEPGCHMVTPMINGEPNWISASAGMTIEQAPPSEITSLIPSIKEPTPGGGASSFGDNPSSTNLPSVNSVNRDSPLSINRSSPPAAPSPKSLRIANFKFAIIQKLSEEFKKPLPETLPLFKNGNNGHYKTKAIQKFIGAYNSGTLLPDIHAEIKEISRASLYNWLKLYDLGGVEALTPQYRGPQASEILPGERDFLLYFLLNQNKPKISDGIRECKRYLGGYSTTNPSTLRRFINQFKIYHHDIWTLKRDGEKAWNDEDAPYQDRDAMLLNVGDVVVADGHKLNLHVIDPLSGKKKRAVLVLFWDWKSTYPLGWEIMFSENTQCIASALRNAVLTLGKIPSNIYIDNGKAFLAKIFTQKLRIEETEIPGMIARLGSRYRRAVPYHGQSKPIERFFLIINDRLERRLPSYTGSSIKDKPPYLLRNEPQAKQAHNQWAPTVEQLSDIMFQWREEYIDEPRPTREGMTARQIFDEGKGVGLDPKALCFLMMAVEVKNVRRSRFTFGGVDWEGPCLYGYRGKVLIRYSLSDYKQIYVFDLKDQFMGSVTQCGKADPIKDWQAAKRINAERKRLKRHTKEFAQYLIQGGKQPDFIDYIEAEEAKRLPEKKYLPFSESPGEGAATNAPARADELPPNVEQAPPSLYNGRPRWKYDHEKYDWLLEQPTLTPNDRAWIENYRANSSLYKHTVFTDGEELDQKVRGGTDERSLFRE